MSESAKPGNPGQKRDERSGRVTATSTSESNDSSLESGKDDREDSNPNRSRRRRGSRGGRKRNRKPSDPQQVAPGRTSTDVRPEDAGKGESSRGRNRNSGKSHSGKRGPQQVKESPSATSVEIEEDIEDKRSGRERKGRPVGRYSMVVHLGLHATQIAILEGRALIQHFVSRAADDVTQIYGNVYLGRVENVLPGMEAAFVDIGTPKNAVLYRGDVSFDREDVDTSQGQPRIEQVLKNRQLIVCQVTKNPIAHKGARLTQEVSLSGRFVVLVPNSKTFGISKRLPDKERKRLRNILERSKPEEHGVIVRTAAENATETEVKQDIARLLKQWKKLEKASESSKSPALLYREPEMSMRIIREEFTKDFRTIVIDDQDLHSQAKEYVSNISPMLAERVQYHDAKSEGLTVFERYHIQEQLLRALDRKVWLPSGGSLIIEHTEALTVIDVNTGKNVGKSSLEETVYRNNLEAAKEVAHQLRLRDIGGIIVIDFVDMEESQNRDEVIKEFRKALARDKTRMQIFDISDLGLVEMTRKRIGAGLLESFSKACPECDGVGHGLDDGLLSDF